MQYLGGKSRISKPISDLMLAERGDRDVYVEPFLGAGSVALRMAEHFDLIIATDVVPDLVMLWQEVIAGWVPPTTVTEDMYRELRHAEPSALRGFVGFPCSFGGKWFGGYARDPQKGRNFAEAASRSMVRRARVMSNALVARASYLDLHDVIGPDMVVYCDPPYAGTTTYGAADPFDNELFWGVMRSWSRRGAAVYVSEYDAPEDFVVVWEGNPITSIAGKGGGSTVRERLYRWNG